MSKIKSTILVVFVSHFQALSSSDVFIVVAGHHSEL